MNEREQRVMTFIRMYIAENRGVSPTLREIARGCGWESSSTTYRLVNNLEEQGHLAFSTLTPGGYRVARGMYIPERV